MTTGGENRSLTRGAVQKAIVGILADMTADWDTDMTGPIGPETRLVEELDFESIDVVQFVVAIEECFRQRGLPFEELLMLDGRYVDEIRVKEAVDFLCTHLNGFGEAPTS